LDGDKRYQVKVRLGVVTDSGDKEGAIIAENPVQPFTEAELGSILKSFEGEIHQVPPMYSALKHKGERLYKLARQGIEVERKARKISIRQIELLSFDEASFDLDVLCSKGTYIRTLAEDIGEKMGCGAHVEVLRRTGVNHFSVEKSFSLVDIEVAAEKGAESLFELLLPINEAIITWPAVRLDDSQSALIKLGQSVGWPEKEITDPMRGALIKLHSDSQGLIGLGEIDENGRLTPKRVFNL
jgi:tRNA pseudouridine55 synthase